MLLVPACSESPSGSPPRPVLPEYSYDGPLGPVDLFRHGVASGDPTPDAVVIWTRVTPELDGPIEVFYEVAEDAGFVDRVSAGTVTTDGERDYTVKLDVRGLAAGTTHHYRFFSLGRGSIVGRTRTAPSGGVDRLRFAVMSCASFQHGYFHGYRNVADRHDLDAVIHLGDYLYEYGPGEYGDVRAHEPPHEAVTLTDYRTRFAQYRSDPDLVAAHLQHPFICIWDDHEVANDSFEGGAENHDPETEGDFAVRRANAVRAWHEWMPIRDREDGTIHRSLVFGDLAELVLLDTRLEGRDEQVGSAAADEASRTLLGFEQEVWLEDRLVAGEARWKLVGQQVMMAQLLVFGLPVNFDQWDGYRHARARLYERIRAAKVSNLVVLTGDIHSSWANDLVEDPLDSSLYDPATGEGAIGVEFVTPAVTSPAVDGPIGSLVESFLGSGNPHVKYVDFMNRGYIVLDVRPEKVQADFFHLDGVGEGQGEERFAAAYATFDGEARVVAMDGPELPGLEPRSIANPRPLAATSGASARPGA